MNRPIPWHPLLFSAVVVMTLWVDAAISPYAAVRSFVIVLLLAAALTGLAAMVTRSLALGGIIATSIIALLWSKQLSLLAGIATSRMGPALAVLWAFLIAIAVLLVGRLLIRSKSSWSLVGATKLLNRGAAVLFLAALLVGAFNGRLQGAIADLDQGTDLGALAQSAGDHAASGPDIYAILLDGYPRADVLRYAFDLDNSPFVEGLEERGFNVASASHSDYLWTHVTVPSALNLDYVEALPEMREVMAEARPRQPTVRRLVAENRAFQFVKEHGYTTVAVASGFEQVAARQADVWIDSGDLNEFEIALLSSTFAGNIVDLVDPKFAAGQQRDRILYNLDVLPRIAGTEGRDPVFVFAHIPSPHQPVVMDHHGNIVPVPLEKTFFADSPIERNEPHDEFVQRYRAQLPYLNARLLEAVDGIIANSSEPPIILLFADHGSATRVDWITAHVASANPALLLERTGTLFAALTPGREAVFPDDISPTDMFRLLFDAYFGTDYGRAVPPEGGGQVAPIDALVLERIPSSP